MIRGLIKRFKSNLESVVDENRTDGKSPKHNQIEVNIQGYVELTGFQGMEHVIMPYVWKEKGEVIVVNKYGNAIPVSLELVKIIGEDKPKKQRAMVSDDAIERLTAEAEKNYRDAVKTIGRSIGF